MDHISLVTPETYPASINLNLTTPRVELRVDGVKRDASFSFQPAIMSMLRVNRPDLRSIEGASGMKLDGAVGMKILIRNEREVILELNRSREQLSERNFPQTSKLFRTGRCSAVGSADQLSRVVDSEIVCISSIGSRIARLHNGSLEWSLLFARVSRDLKTDTCRAITLFKDGDIIRVAAKSRNMLLHPVQTKFLI
jgi:hypothetical protein